jgi:small conductance mechanosensitive channel
MLDQLWHTLVERGVEYAGRGLGILLILVLGWLAVYLLVGPLRRVLARTRVDPSVASFLANSARSVIIVVVFLAVLQELGVATTSLLTVLATAGLAVALSLQGALANFASGLLVLTYRVVRVGDLVEVGDFRGRVAELLPFHIILITADNQRITVPNTLLTNGAVRNNSSLAVRRAQWTLPLKPQDDLAAVKAALRSQLQVDPRILPDPVPQLFVQDWTEEKRTLVIHAWTSTADNQAVQQDLLEVLGARLEAFRRGEASVAGGSEKPPLLPADEGTTITQIPPPQP